MATATATSGVWIIQHTIQNDNINPTFILETQNKFVDKNINVKITTPVADGFNLAITDTPTANLTLSATSTYYLVSGNISGTVNATTGGWLATGTNKTVSDSDIAFGKIAASTLSATSITPQPANAQTVYISPGYYSTTRTVAINGMNSGTQAVATVTASGAIQSSAISVANVSSSFTGMTQVAITPTTTALTSASATYFVAVKATVTDQNLTFTKAVNTAGYLGAISQITANGAVSGNNVTYYAPLASAKATLSGSKAATAPTMAYETATGKTSTAEGNGTITTTQPSASTEYISIKVTAPATTSITPTVSLTNAGYLGAAGQITGSVSTTTATQTYYIPLKTGALKSNSGTVTAESNTINGTIGTTATSDYYITLTGSGQVGVETEGWVTTAMTQNSSVMTRYYNIPRATFTTSGKQVSVNTAGYIPANTVVGTIGDGTISTTATNVDDSSLSGYAKRTDIIVPANGTLLLSAGYYNATKIGLGTLIPDDSNYTNATSNNILAGYEAYSSSGQKLIGTIATYAGAYTVS